MKTDPVAQQYLSPDRSPLLNLPGIRSVAAKHQELMRWMTLHFVGVRAEEHRMFLATAIQEGMGLRQLRDRGILPADAHIAVDCVGAIPYFSGLRTLDRLGLTDAHVARSAPVREVMAHSKLATMEYAKERGVDLWSVDAVHLIQPLTSMPLMIAVQDGIMYERDNVAVDVGVAGYLICRLPCGLEATRRRFPGAQILEMQDSSFVRNYLVRSRTAWSDSLRANPYHVQAARNLGYILLLAQDYQAAVHHYTVMTQTYPELLEGFEHLSLAQLALGHEPEGLAAAERAMQLATRYQDAAAAERIRARVTEALGARAER